MSIEKIKQPAAGLSNKDLLPLEQEQRTWKAVNFASIWMGCIHNIPTYATVGGLIAIGLSPWQVLAIIITASLILFGALALNGHAGAKYGLPFPVIIRASYGVYGANIPALLRGFVAIMWLGIQTFAGSTALHILLLNVWPGWGSLGGDWNVLGLHASGLLSFVFFWAIHLLVLNHGMESIKKFEVWAGPLVYLVFGGMVWWAVDIAGGLGPIYSQPGKFHSFAETFWPFAAGVTGIIGIWATLILNIPDFTRFAKTQKEQIKGQFYGLPGTFALFAFASITVTSGSQVAFGEPIWDVVDILARFDNPYVIALSVITLCIATISVNVAANIVSPAYDLANVWPKYINFRRGSYLTAVLALFTIPWKLMESATSVYAFLGLIGGMLGPVAGVMMADYFIIRKRQLFIDELYSETGRYAYYKGYNYRAFLATFLGALISLIGMYVPALAGLYDISWFVGVLISFLSYITLMRLHPPYPAAVPVPYAVNDRQVK
ncbi:allantoin permease [Bacillus atrophaeus]|uniref:NCS1 family nucleobase:cation symporter-1 n=1 Tax=Bacillus atrophaeus TaxID=1452 RepID=UPI000D05811A|nr:NCS1 family nucleobase:cation symporter-1 [Bacillus atrophaeus]PSA90506.1 allantoin permease [Bacillus atrophaeus]